jgi:putative flippase GtrA
VIGRKQLVLRYALFAVVATSTNIGAQWLSMRLYGGNAALTAAMAVGTIVGLLTKYVLDKNWIFFDREGGAYAHGRKFLLYSLMGVVTTFIFWGMELGFDAISNEAYMKYVGAALGLAIGYATKYQLDRRLVFKPAMS